MSLPSQQLLVPSVLDRLLDDEPHVSTEPWRKQFQSLSELKQSLARDLEDLLNSRRRCVSWPAHLTELEQSLINYGIPDFGSENMSIPSQREELCKIIETVLRRNEPRLKTVKVRLQESSEPLNRSLHFQIEAMIHLEPAPEPVLYHSYVEPTAGNFEVKAHE